jgi:hypothetical protein
MLRFDPPSFRNELAEATETWKQMIDVSGEDDFPRDMVDVTDPDFDPADYEDRTVTPNTKCELTLPRWEEVAQFTYGEFVELARELPDAVLEGNVECRTEHRYLLRVRPANDQATRYLLHTLPEAETETERGLQEQYLEKRREERALWVELKAVFDEDIFPGDERFDEELSEAWDQARWRCSELGKELEKPVRRFCSVEASCDGNDVRCSLTEGFTVFGAAVAASGDYDKYLPPIMDDLFVEVRYQHPISIDTARYIADSYLFELSSTLDLEFEMDPRPTLEDEDLYSESELRAHHARLRPLLLGRGMPELLKLYRRALAASDYEIQLMYFAKVIEYVSQTVVRQQATEVIRAKLLSPRSLRPDVEFIAELQSVVEDQRIFRKDREAIKQTVITCCEASELSRVAPPFLSKLRAISPSDRSREKEEALVELGYSLSATRNLVAHAKANYEPTGEECPEGQLADFAECTKLAAQQVIRWYHSRPEDLRAL